MKTFNSDSMMMQHSKGENIRPLNTSYDVANYEKIEPSVIPFQLLDKSSKRLTDIYFILHPEALEFTDPVNLSKYLNQQANQNVPISHDMSDEQILSSINSRYHSTFEDIHQLLKSLDDNENQLSERIKKELDSNKSLNDLLELYKNFKNSNQPKNEES